MSFTVQARSFPEEPAALGEVDLDPATREPARIPSSSYASSYPETSDGRNEFKATATEGDSLEL